MPYVNGVKKWWTLQIEAQGCFNVAVETMYAVTRHPAKDANDIAHKADAQPWSRLGPALEQIGWDPFGVELLKMRLGDRGSETIREILLDHAALRTIGFTDV